MNFFNLAFSDLHLDRDEIFLNLGYGGHTPNEYVAQEIERIIAHANTICCPRAGYCISTGQLTDNFTIEIDKVPMKIGSIIAGYLVPATHIATFVATAGKEYDEYLQQLKVEDDIVNEFLADAVGSEIAEATVRYVADKIEQDAKEMGFLVTKSYSPGYCGWNVRQQKQLFSLLPNEPCGIILNDSCLMHPVKSVSGIIGLGTDIELTPYSCEICELKTCYKRKQII